MDPVAPGGGDCQDRESVTSRVLGKFVSIDLVPNRSGKPGSPEPCYLVIHLGMTGQPHHRAILAIPVPPAHTCFFFFALDDGPASLRYADVRPVRPHPAGPGIADRGSSEDRLGLRKPLEITLEEFPARDFGSRRARVKALLLDQRVLRGVGQPLYNF